MAHKILEEAQEMNDLLIKWRRDLHQIPETDLELPKTVEYISKRLDEMNVEYKVFPEVSVIIAQIGKGDKCFLLRNYEIIKLNIKNNADNISTICVISHNS